MAGDRGVKTSWSDTVRLAEVGRGAETHTLEPDAAVRTALARELGLVDLPELSAQVQVSPWLDGAEVRGDWRAQVVQTCGVTLEPFETALSGSFEVKAVPAGSPVAVQEEASEIELSLDSADPPDVLESDRVDLAAYVVEHLALELDPFPRKPGVEFQPPEAEPEASPFAALLELKPKR
jgi:uncharacterized metal-binding protein YceD (DUF177 family)